MKKIFITITLISAFLLTGINIKSTYGNNIQQDRIKIKNRKMDKSSVNDYIGKRQRKVYGDNSKSNSSGVRVKKRTRTAGFRR
ncbi:MAG: hypothetical protein Q8880_10890 [Bacteroidota bacterium]|nr:hypothetical protein [Bacteroidota bacterium]